MRVEGRWQEFPDGVARPVIEAKVQGANGKWLDVTFLLDAGADRTVFDAASLAALAPLALPADQTPKLGGVGGPVDCLFIQTRIAFTRTDGKQVTVNGSFGVFTDPVSSDISVLGRDVTNNFDVIYSFPKREVLLLAAPHGYVVQMPF
jgi:hypothetical protein